MSHNTDRHVQNEPDCVAQSSLIFAHITMQLQDGSVVDSSKAQGKPSVIQLGNDSVSLAMESELLGLKVGEQKKFKLSAEDSFGDAQPDLIHFMDVQQFASDIELTEGTVIEFEQPSGGVMPGIIRERQGHSVKVDFNHPLAGQEVTFDVEILAIDSPPEMSK